VGRFDSLLAVAGLLGSLAVLVAARSVEPDPSGRGTHERLGLAPCSFLMRTGKPCLTCGMTTAFAHMARAEPLGALRANPLGAALFLGALATPWWCVRSLRLRRSPLAFLDAPRARVWLPVGALVLLLNWGWMLLRAEGRA